MSSFSHLFSRLPVLLLVTTTSISAFMPATSHALGKAKTRYQISLGDSISAAFIGYTQTDASPAGIASDQPKPPHTWRGVRYVSVLESKRAWSWASGQDIDSVGVRLEDYLNTHRTGRTRIHLEILNQAESSAQARHIPRQALQAFESIGGSEGLKDLELVTLLVGANDACRRIENQEEDIAQIREDLLLALSYFSTGPADHKIPVFFSSIPNIPGLSLPEVAQHRAYFGVTCQAVRDKIVNFCPDLLNWKTPGEYEASLARVRFINQILKETARVAAVRFPTLDIHYDESFSQTQMDPSFLAWDCFHPGRDGQAFLADQFWKAMPWFQ